MVNRPIAPLPGVNRPIEFLSRNKEFLFLTLFSSILAYSFVLDSFATGDSLHYAMGVQTIWEQGLRAIPNTFNGEMSFGYYVLLDVLNGVFKSKWELSTIMNLMSALASIAMLCFFFMMIMHLINSKRVALFTCLTVLLSPTIFYLSHYGHPIMLSLAFFIGSLLLLVRSDIENIISLSQTANLILFILFSYCAIVLRLDIILAFGAYFGILYYNQKLSVSNIVRLIIILIVVFTLVFFSRYYILGYFVNPTGGTFAYNIHNRIHSAYILKIAITNLILWPTGVNLFISALAIFGIILFGVRSAWAVLVFFWIIPYFGFIPFDGMDIPRIMAPTVPIISLIAISFLDQKIVFAKTKTIVMSLALVIAQLVSIAIYYPLDRIYPFKVKVENRALAQFPLGFLITDHYYRQRLIWARNNAAMRVASERNNNVLIIAFADYAIYYNYYIKLYHTILSTDKVTVNSATFEKIITKDNIFYIYDSYSNKFSDNPIYTTIHYLNNSVNKIHIPPFWTEFPVDDDKNLYLKKEDIIALLDHEKSIFNTRRKIISR